jgi:copper chaperone
MNASDTHRECGMTTTAYHVSGMSCGHCIEAVTKELEQLEGVLSVTIDLAAGVATVSSEAPLDAALVRAAVSEAGYEVAA